MSQCKQCNTDFQITARETALREKIAANFEAGPVPLPTLCPDSRMQRPIRTTYAPERPEKVVCEACYLKEVYQKSFTGTIL